MPLGGVDRLLWATGFLGHVVLLGVLLYRRRAELFPAFTALITLNVLRTVLLFSLRDLDKLYERAYFAFEFLDVSLQLAVVYEIARHVFRPGSRWAPDVKFGLLWLVPASLILASALTWLAVPPAHRWDRMVVLKASFFSSALMSELFLGILVLSATVGLPWKTHVARIAHGLGAFCLADVLIEAIHTLDLGAGTPAIRDVLTFARMSVYLICLLYWIVTLWQEAPEPRSLPPKMLANLHTLNTRLTFDLFALRNGRRP